MEDSQDNSNLVIRVVLLGIILLFVSAVIYAEHVTTARNQAAQNRIDQPTKYTNYVYHISLNYPADWQPTSGYNYDHYNGPAGFFGISAVGTATTSLDILVKNDTNHVLKPYGSVPSIDKVLISGQEARLITPSLDQDKNLKMQAELIVKYPKAVTINGQVYNYFVLWADQAHIGAIANSLAFLP